MDRTNVSTDLSQFGYSNRKISIDKYAYYRLTSIFFNKSQCLYAKLFWILNARVFRHSDAASTVEVLDNEWEIQILCCFGYIILVVSKDEGRSVHAVHQRDHLHVFLAGLVTG